MIYLTYQEFSFQPKSYPVLSLSQSLDRQKKQIPIVHEKVAFAQNQNNKQFHPVRKEVK